MQFEINTDEIVNAGGSDGGGVANRHFIFKGPRLYIQ